MEERKRPSFWTIIAVPSLILNILLIILVARTERRLAEQRVAAPSAAPAMEAVRPPATPVEPPSPRPAPTQPPEKPKEPPKPAKEETAAPKPDDPVGIVAYGAVTAEGQPLAQSCYVNFVDAEGQQVHAMTAEKTGIYAIPGLRPGAWRIICRPAAYPRYEREVTIEPQPAFQRFDIELATAVTLKIKFTTPDGRPLVEAQRELQGPRGGTLTAVATKEDPSGKIPMTELSSVQDFGIGMYRTKDSVDVPSGYDGVLILSEPLPAYVSALQKFVVLQTKQVSAGTTEVEFAIAPDDLARTLCEVKLRVVDAVTNAPVKNAGVELNDRQSSGGGVRTTEDGTATLKNQPPGLRILTIRGAGGYEHFEEYRRLEPGKFYDFGDVRLSPAVKIHGTIVDPNGKLIDWPLSFYKLDRVSPTESMSFSYSSTYQRAGVKWKPGEFEIGGIGRGRYLLLPGQKQDEQEWALTPTIVDTTAGSVENVRIQLRRGTAVILEPQGAEAWQPVVGIASQGTLIWARRIWSHSPVRLNLLPGEYTLTVAHNDRVTRTQTFSVGATTLRIPLP